MNFEATHTPTLYCLPRLIPNPSLHPKHLLKKLAIYSQLDRPPPIRVSAQADRYQILPPFPPSQTAWSPVRVLR